MFGFGGVYLKGDFFVGSRVWSFSIVLCILGGFFDIIGSRWGFVTGVLEESLLVVSRLCSFFFVF